MYSIVYVTAQFERDKKMNEAQKRAWFYFVISLAGILIGAAVITFIKVNELNFRDASNHAAFRILSLPLMLPLILMVIVSARFKKKDFDERDKQIERKSLFAGTMATFIFLGGASWLLVVTTRMGPITSLSIIWLVYLAAFLWYLISSVAALIQYGKGGK